MATTPPPAAATTEAEAKKEAAAADPIYVTVDSDHQEVTEIESLCMNCYKQGTTRLMFLKVC